MTSIVFTACQTSDESSIVEITEEPVKLGINNKITHDYECNTKKFEKELVPAVPEDSYGTVSEKIEYIFHTDHSDRFNGLVLKEPKRDSIRLETVMDWYDQGLITDWEDKYNAGFVLIHTGGPLYMDDAECYHAASKLFFEVSKESGNPMIQAESQSLAITAFSKFITTRINEELGLGNDILSQEFIRFHIEVDDGTS